METLEKQVIETKVSVSKKVELTYAEIKKLKQLNIDAINNRLANINNVEVSQENEIDNLILSDFDYWIQNKAELISRFNCTHQQISTRFIKLHKLGKIPYTKVVKEKILEPTEEFISWNKFNAVCDKLLQIIKHNSVQSNCMNQYKNHFGKTKETARRKFVYEVMKSNIQGNICALSSTNLIVETYLNHFLNDIQIDAVEINEETQKIMAQKVATTTMKIDSYLGDICEHILNQESNHYSHLNLDFMSTLPIAFPMALKVMNAKKIKKGGLTAFTFQYNLRSIKMTHSKESNRIIKLLNKYNKCTTTINQEKNNAEISKIINATTTFLNTEVPKGYELIDIVFYHDGCCMAQAIYKKL